ncbi:hypothetical protein ACLPJK_25840 [Pseudomonas aeruginosa]|uniref:hypothetical protein n=1 Tax=Pseudomonas aeruginosa TaxID=287 RepID=UPI003D2811A3
MSANPIIPKYPLDWTGVNPVNKITGELHILGVDKGRAFVTDYGPFFVESVKVYVANTGQELVRRTQYLIMQPDQEASKRFGKDIASVIYVTDKTVGTDIVVDYQLVGGEFSFYARAIRDLLESVNIDDRPVSWMDIIGKPTTFPPSPHLHDLGDTYGWEYIGQQLEGIARALLMGDVGSHNELRQQFLYQIDLVRQSVDDLDFRFGTHLADTDNPHQVTKVQVGLGNVDNFATATQAEAQAGTRNDRFMTPLRTKQAIDIFAGQLLQAHIDDKNNPHSVTKGQVGLGNVQNYGLATQVQAEQGSVGTVYMTPLSTKQAIAYQVGNALTAHIQNTNNPHSVTKSQVGLSAVENYGVATQAQAQAGAASNVYMTPLRTKQAIDALIGATVTAHINNKNNPHSVTAAQVGLGSVENYPLATQAQAEAGTANVAYMTPLRTKQAITLQAVTPLNTHINNKNNPHSVTAAQVGAYTQAQTNTLLAAKLGKTETAANSSLVYGYDYTTLRNNIRANLDGGLITTGLVNPRRLSNNEYANGTVLAYSSTFGPIWRSFADMYNEMAQQQAIPRTYYQGNIYTSPTWDNDGRNEALAIVANTFVNNTAYPPGTMVAFQTTYTDSWGTGNGVATQVRTGTFLSMKVAAGSWVILSAIAPNN